MTGTVNKSSSPRSRAPSLNTIHDYIEERKDQLAYADSIEFNTIQFCRDLGRRAALSVLTIHILQVLNIDKLPQMN